jgi:hypothetical protein
MRTITGIRVSLLGALASIAVALPATAADRPYTEGSVLNVSAIRTESGKFEAYMRYLAGPYKQSMDAAKAAGIILDYSIYRATPRGPGDPDVYLVTVYKNLAAMDDLQSRMDPIQEKTFGSPQQVETAGIERNQLRSLVGSELLRELVLK